MLPLQYYNSILELQLIVVSAMGGFYCRYASTFNYKLFFVDWSTLEQYAVSAEVNSANRVPHPFLISELAVMTSESCRASWHHASTVTYLLNLNV
jgi:hypothetical protein